jgi:hypothetical protein
MYKNFSLTESEKEQILNMHKNNGYGKKLREGDDEKYFARHGEGNIPWTGSSNKTYGDLPDGDYDDETYDDFDTLHATHPEFHSHYSGKGNVDNAKHMFDTYKRSQGPLLVKKRRIQNDQPLNEQNNQENVDGVSSGGYGILSKNQQGDVTEDMVATSKSPSNDFLSFLKQQGFRDWSGGNKNYGMRFHYINRKPGTPANLTCVIGQPESMGTDKVEIDILFDSVVERAERYSSLAEFEAKSAIPKIEKLVGTGFDMNNDKSFNLRVKTIDLAKAKQVIVLYNQIKMVGPYSKVTKTIPQKKAVVSEQESNPFKVGQTVKAIRDKDNKVYTIQIAQIGGSYVGGKIMGPGKYQDQPLDGKVVYELTSNKPGQLSGNMDMGIFKITQ